ASHCNQRIRPAPAPGRLLARAGTVLLAAAAYALAELVLFRPLLFSCSLLKAAAVTAAPQAHQTALIYGVALALGVVLELAWEDRPLTQPL
ncbi:MAG: hypothetical protein KDD47_19040, partial [Acidobacteria bacterium]|nr:hypothetical protein [Acidobacteriota bacterium]